ncbi:MAG: papain-like cysteine protease family protein, partial [Ignavibacteriota bacterium]
MNTLFKRFILLCTLLGALLLFQASKNEEPSQSYTISLHVPFIAQIASNFCWAACTNMVTAYYHGKNTSMPILSQCELSKLNAPGLTPFDCDTLRKNNLPWEYDQGGAPFPVDPATGTCNGYKPTYYNQNQSLTMPWATLKQMISDSTPVIFGWNWNGVTIASVNDSDSHYIVAEAVSQSKYYPDSGWVSINDPWPVNGGRHRVIAYSEYG